MKKDKVVNKKDIQNLKDNKCATCGTKLNNNTPLFNCNKCKGDLCNKCGNNHAKTNPNHKLTLVKYDVPEKPETSTDEIPKCNQCGTDLKNEYKKCDNCDIPLCKNCGSKHEKRNPNHKLKNKSR